MSLPTLLPLPTDAPLPPGYYEALARAEEVNGSGAASGILPATTGYHVRLDDEIESLPPTAWLAAGILPEAALAVLYGPPGAGKSFVALDLALSVASGSEWLGRAIRPTGALYLAAEGTGGLGQRLRVWKTARGFSGKRVGVAFITSAIDLLDNASAPRLIATAHGLDRPPGLIIIDTLARSMVGDENNTGDMSRLIATVDRVREATSATILLVHHTKKEGELERGSSALRGGVDTLIYCSDGDEGRQLVCMKQKDGEKFEPIPFRLIAGAGSCFVSANSGPTAAPMTVEDQMTPVRLKALRTLSESFTTRGATTTEWLKATDLAERTFYRVRTWLVKEGYVIEFRARYTISPSGREDLKRAIKVTATTTATELPSQVALPFAAPLKGAAGGHSGGFTATTATEKSGSNRGSKVAGDELGWDDLQAEIDERLGQRDD